jgi:hypothetical protein
MATKTTLKAAAPRKAGTTSSGLVFKKTKTVTVPVLKLMPDQPVYIKVENAMEMSRQVAGAKVAGQSMEPATIMHCTNLDSDTECLLIVGTMLKSVIEESYPNQSYVGLCFEVTNHGKRGDKKYNAYSLTEIEVE